MRQRRLFDEKLAGRTADLGAASDWRYRSDVLCGPVGGLVAGVLGGALLVLLLSGELGGLLPRREWDITDQRLDDDQAPLVVSAPVRARQTDRVHSLCRHFDGPAFQSDDGFSYDGTPAKSCAEPVPMKGVRAVGSDDRLRRPWGCSEEEALTCAGAPRENCMGSLCCMWTLRPNGANTCIAVDFSRQLWLGMAGARASFTEQKMNLMLNMAVVDALLRPEKALLASRWEVVVTLPPIWRSFMPPYHSQEHWHSGRHSSLTSSGRDTGPHGFRDMMPADFGSLFDLQLTRHRLHSMADKVGRTLHVVELSADMGETRLSVAMPTAFAGGVKEDDPRWHRVGEGWVPWTDRQECHGGGYRPPGEHTGPDGRTVFDSTLPATVEAVAARLAVKLPARAAAGEGLSIHNLNGCDDASHAAAASQENLHAARTAPHLVGVIDKWLVALERRAQPGAFDGFGVLQLSGSMKRIAQALPLAVSCADRQDPSSARPGLLYVWAPVDAVTSDVFREWRHSVRERFTVVTARDLDPDFMEMVEGEPKRQYPQGRQEYEGMEAALIERAAWLLGWHPRMRSSQLACAILEANGRPCQYLSECVRG